MGCSELCSPIFFLMKETRKLPLAFLVETLILSRRNKLGLLMCDPRRGWQLIIRDDSLRGEAGSPLSEKIHFGKANVTCKISDPSLANFHQGRSNLLVAISPLPVLIKEGPASWWHNLPLCEGLRPCPGGTICSAKDYGLIQEEGLSCPVGLA